VICAREGSKWWECQFIIARPTECRAALSVFTAFPMVTYVSIGNPSKTFQGSETEYS
jgi:hypothetical protein